MSGDVPACFVLVLFERGCQNREPWAPLSCESAGFGKEPKIPSKEATRDGKSESFPGSLSHSALSNQQHGTAELVFSACPIRRPIGQLTDRAVVMSMSAQTGPQAHDRFYQ